MPKKLKRGTLWDFSTSVLSENSKKIEGGTLWGNFFFEKKVSQSRKYSKGVEYPLVPLSFLDDVTILQNPFAFEVFVCYDFIVESF